jgi:hypothetical protein
MTSKWRTHVVRSPNGEYCQKVARWGGRQRTLCIPFALALALAALQCGESSKDHETAEGGEAGASAGETGGSPAVGEAGSAATASGGDAAGGESATGGRVGTGGSRSNTGGAATGGRGGSSGAPQGGSTNAGGTGAGGRSTGGDTHTGGRTALGGTGGRVGSGGQAPVGGTGGEVKSGGAAGEAPIGGGEAAGEGGASSGGTNSGGTAGTGGSTGGGGTGGSGGMAGTGGSGGTAGTGGSGGETLESCFAGLRALEGSWQISMRENVGEPLRLRLALETGDRFGTSGTYPWAAVRLALEIDGSVICLDETALAGTYHGSLHNCADVLRFEYGELTYEIEAPDVPKTADLTVLSSETVVRGPITLSTTECDGGGGLSTECRSGGPC